MITTEKGIFIEVKLSPNGSKNEILGLAGDVLRVKVTAPPLEGRANKAMLEFLSEKLDIPKSDIILTKGHTSKIKTLFIEKRYEERLKAFLGKLS